MSLRDDFEKLFPVPLHVVWNPAQGAYTSGSHFFTDIAEAFQGAWVGFQAGHAAGLEAAAVECDKQEKSLYSTLKGNSDAIPSSIGAGICAEAIRAMKP